MRKWILIFVGLIAVSVFVGPLVKSPDKPAGPTYAPAVVEAAVKQKLRDPDSAIFGSMSVYGDRKLAGKSVTVVCGSVNAKNGFGGYTGSTDFVFVKDTLSVTLNGPNNARFVKDWNVLCAGHK
jgi:hypothetical protein